MRQKIYSIITGTGSYLPTRNIINSDFHQHTFYNSSGEKIEKTNEAITKQFQEITTIKERRYITDDLLTSDIAYLAAKEAIKSAKIDPESLDYIIMAHNFGDVKPNSKSVDIVPSLAARVKAKLKIKNPSAVAYDISFGCPGWLQAFIQANYYIQSGDAKRILIIGAETLSRVIDPHDVDSLLYADGAGATIIEAQNSESPLGVIAHKTRSDTHVYSEMLYMDESYNSKHGGKENNYLKMNGRKIYQYALETVPQAIKECLEKAKVSLVEVKKILIHQANGKMDDAILERLFALYNLKQIPENIMPMTVSWLGNSSVATIPTLLDLIVKGKMEKHKLTKGDTLIFASVGAGMNINAMVYKY